MPRQKDERAKLNLLLKSLLPVPQLKALLQVARWDRVHLKGYPGDLPRGEAVVQGRGRAGTLKSLNSDYPSSVLRNKGKHPLWYEITPAGRRRLAVHDHAWKLLDGAVNRGISLENVSVEELETALDPFIYEEKEDDGKSHGP